MTAVELESVLDFDLMLDIGHEKNSNRVHKLFYSKKDHMCFVAIQDIKTGTVITILPLDYHENIAWTVSLESQNQAKAILTGTIKPTHSDIPLPSPQKQTPFFRISATVVDHFGSYQKTIKLGDWHHPINKNNIADLTKNEEFIRHIDKKIKEKSQNYDKKISFISSISIKQNKNSIPIVLDIQIFQGKIKIDHPD